jgi:hypothetical protein
MKRHPEDIIWNTIIASARSKFDYPAFQKKYGSFDNDRVLDTVLFQILDGLAEEQSPADIAANLSHDLGMLSYPFADQNLESFVSNHEKLLAQEIKTTALALKMFNQNQEIPEILKAVEELLCRN